MSADGLWIGSAAAFVYAAWDEAGVRPRGALFLVPAIAILGATLWMTPLLDEIGRFQGIAMGSVLAVGFGALLLGVLAGVGPRLRALLVSRPLLCVSRLSYSLYLVHMVFLGSVYAALGAAVGWQTWPAAARFLVYVPCLLLVSTAAAVVLHYAVEKPFLRIKDRI